MKFQRPATRAGPSSSGAAINVIKVKRLKQERFYGPQQLNDVNSLNSQSWYTLASPARSICYDCLPEENACIPRCVCKLRRRTAVKDQVKTVQYAVAKALQQPLTVRPSTGLGGRQLSKRGLLCTQTQTCTFTLTTKCIDSRSIQVQPIFYMGIQLFTRFCPLSYTPATSLHGIPCVHTVRVTNTDLRPDNTSNT